MSFAFPRREKLKSKKTIEMLFSEGRSVSAFPLKLFFMGIEGSESSLAAFAVPKRNFNKAVDRNRIKRKLREAYRCNKSEYSPNTEAKYALLFLYTGSEVADFEQIQASVIKLLKKIQT